MSFDNDSPLSIKRDNSLEAVEVRYRRATETSIVLNHGILFESLADIPRLIIRIKELEVSKVCCCAE